MKMKLEDINISKMKPIGQIKMVDKLAYYLIYKKPSETIVIDNEGYLVDGYSTYIIYEALGKKKVKVKILGE